MLAILFYRDFGCQLLIYLDDPRPVYYAGDRLAVLRYLHNLLYMQAYYKTIYRKAAQYGGWSGKEPDKTIKWGDLYEYVLTKLSGAEVVLDIGTAEGNRFLKLASSIRRGVGVDIEEAMIRLAEKNKEEARVKNITFRVANTHKLLFQNEQFDGVIAKHSPIGFKEAYRILRVGGWLITQQVHETDKANLKRAFRRGQGFKKRAGELLRRYKTEAKEAGFHHIRAKISNDPYHFPSKTELLRFLRKTPTIPKFGKYKKDWDALGTFIQRNKTKHGIRSNTARFLLEMKK